eukprot:SAG22_NODE_12699_length_432_cov_1.444444_1_plen_69_part_10
MLFDRPNSISSHTPINSNNASNNAANFTNGEFELAAGSSLCLFPDSKAFWLLVAEKFDSPYVTYMSVQF